MRILQVTPHYYPEVQFGGPPRKIHALSRGLVERGHQVSVVTFHSLTRHLNRRCEVENIPVQYLSWVGYGTRQFPMSISRLRKHIEMSEVVHLYGLYNAICPLASYFARHCCRPTVIEPLGMYCPKGSSRITKRLYHRLFTHRSFKRSAAVIAASEEERTELAEVVEPGKLVVRRNGIDASEFGNLPSASQFRNAHQLGSSEGIVLFLGRISPIKNVELLVRAFASAALPQTRLILAGPLTETNYVRRVRSLIHRLGMEKRIALVGPLHDNMKLSALAASALFVLPSISESFGNAAAEAVAAGVPVLLTETCGIANLIHGRAGLAVPPDENAVIQGLRTMMGPRVTEFTGLRSQVLGELSWTEPLNQTEELYRRLLQLGPT